VTTIASGLAAAMSELGSGNVLLVDMGIPNGLAHPFYKGKPVCPLNEALEGESRSEALVQDNLFLATANPKGGEAGGQTLAIVPAKFSAMMPMLKASDYDYIIFDLPPVTSTSPAASLASMLDMTFLVVEAEKSNREAVKRSIALLTAARANIGGILNKTRNYLPAWLHPEV
jgi:Mrp family chromosome partitioning ATPase